MSILSAELKPYKDVSGRLSANEIISGYANALFRDVTPPEQLAGITLTEKLLYKIANDNETRGVNARFFISDITPGGSRTVLYAGTQRNEVGDLTGSERKYGAGRLSADAIASATSIIVDVETGNSAESIFQVGDEIRIFDGTSKQFIILNSVSWAGDQATLGLATPLDAGYLAATPTVIASCIETAAIECLTDNWVETSTSGTYDEAGNPVVNDNLGGIEETWTLTFTSAVDFTVIGDTVGNIGGGNISANFTPVNPNFSKPYYSLLAAGFAGSWAINDTIVFQTHPAAQPLFADLIINPGTTAYSNDNIKIKMYVESA